jgi:hypothetical protein
MALAQDNPAPNPDKNKRFLSCRNLFLISDTMVKGIDTELVLPNLWIE